MRKREVVVSLGEVGHNIYDNPSTTKREEILRARLALFRIVVPIVREQLGLAELPKE
jgi:hypothetical protein